MIDFDFNYAIDPLIDPGWVDKSFKTHILGTNPYVLCRLLLRVFKKDIYSNSILYYPATRQVRYAKRLNPLDVKSLIDPDISHCAFSILPDLNSGIYINLRDEITIISTSQEVSEDALICLDLHFAKSLLIKKVGFAIHGQDYGLNLVRGFLDKARQDTIINTIYGDCGYSLLNP